MDPREELAALRRMAELEAKASGQPTAAPSEIPGPRTRKEMFVDELRQVAAPFAGISSAAGNIMFGGQRLLGKGLEAAGNVFAPDQTLSGLITGKQPTNIAQQAGAFLQEDAAQRLAQEQAKVAQFKRDFPMATGAGELGAEMLVTAPVGGALAMPLKKAATMSPALAKFLTPVATAVETSGFGKTGLTGAANFGARAVGGAITGAATAELTGGDAEVGGAIGAVVPAFVAPVAKAGINQSKRG